MTSTSGAAPAPAPLPEHRPGILRQVLADQAALESCLAELDVQPLLLVYAHLTGDTAMLDRFAPFIKGAWGFEEEVPEDMKTELRQKLVATFREYANADRPPAACTVTGTARQDGRYCCRPTRAGNLLCDDL